MSFPAMQNGSPIPPFQGQPHIPTFPSASPTLRAQPQPQPQPHQPLQPQSSPSTAGQPPGPSSFKAPAHKHAHHLHTIPPREKSTRTLIIDHMLWVHARTRFAQARAELGMTDRTGGPSSPNYHHRERPEQYEEEDEAMSDGEDVERLKARVGHSHTHDEDEDTRLQKQNLALARSLRLRAIAVEKVVTSMLDQPPPLPVLADELPSPPSSPKRGENRSAPKTFHPHTLPNGVRLGLALGTVINDLFARQAPLAPYRHHHQPPPIVVSNNATSEKGSSGSFTPNSSPLLQNPSPHPSTATSSHSSGGVTGMLPPSLLLLASISGGSTPPPFPSSSAVPSTPIPAVQGQAVQGTQGVLDHRIRTYYMEGTDPSTANSPPALRCPRHLHTGCEICVEAKQAVKAPGGPGKGKGPAWGGETTSRPPQIGSGKSMGGSGGGITGWQDGSGIGSGLAQPGINGSVLRRKSKWFQQDTEETSVRGSGAGNTRLSDLIPRFLRLSALVAIELGQELGEDDYQDRDYQGERSGETRFATPASPQAPFQIRKDHEAGPLRPSREWYLLFAGLLTRAALEGYLTGGWRGPDAANCLLSVGLGISGDPSGSDDDDSGESTFEWFDPDNLPSLKEAAHIMFPALGRTANGLPPRREDAEAEFEVEMKERLRRFYTIPSLTPDLSTHMEDLAWHYPAEPVERAALRFCEAIAKWRGKPELETYKKKPKESATLGMTIESLVHSNPTSPTSGVFPAPSSAPKSKRPPTIEHYFMVPHSLNGRKRRRSTLHLDDGDRSTKRVH